MAATAYLLEAARRHDLRRHRSRPQARGGDRDHEGAGDRTHARGGQRRHGRARRQGRAGRPAQLSGQPLSRGADRHHGRGRQHRDARADPVRPGRDPQPSLSAQGDDSRSRTKTTRAASTQFDKRVLGPCRAQHRQCVPRLGPRLDRRDVCAGAGRRRGEPLLQAARALRLGVRARRRYCVADARRRAQAPGNGLRALRRHSVRALSAVGRAQALGGRGAAGGRSAAGRMVHGERLRHHRDAASTRYSPISPTGRWHGCCASCCCRRAAPARAVRPIDGSLRELPARAVGHARPAHRRHFPWNRRQRPGVAGTRLRDENRVARSARTIIGIMPRAFGGPYSRNNNDGWLPLGPGIGAESPVGCTARRICGCSRESGQGPASKQPPNRRCWRRGSSGFRTATARPGNVSPSIDSTTRRPATCSRRSFPSSAASGSCCSSRARTSRTCSSSACSAGGARRRCGWRSARRAAASSGRR